MEKRKKSKSIKEEEKAQKQVKIDETPKVKKVRIKTALGPKNEKISISQVHRFQPRKWFDETYSAKNNFIKARSSLYHENTYKGPQMDFKELKKLNQERLKSMYNDQQIGENHSVYGDPES